MLTFFPPNYAIKPVTTDTLTPVCIIVGIFAWDAREEDNADLGLGLHPNMHPAQRSLFVLYRNGR